MTDIPMLLVTVAAAGVVAWQSFETRRSASAAIRASKGAEGALEVARNEEQHSRELIAETIRARIDANTPDVLVTVTSEPDVVLDMTEAQPELPFRLPRDNGVKLSIGFAVTIHNGNSIAVEIARQGPQHREASRTWSENETILVRSQSSFRVDILVTRSVREWAIIAADSGQGSDEKFELENYFPRASEIYFNYVTPADTGVWDIRRIRLSGSPLTSVPQQDGAWTTEEVSLSTTDAINDPPKLNPMNVQRLPVERRYYLSRSRDIELPSSDMVGLEDAS